MGSFYETVRRDRRAYESYGRSAAVPLTYSKERVAFTRYIIELLRCDTEIQSFPIRFLGQFLKNTLQLCLGTRV